MIMMHHLYTRNANNPNKMSENFFLYLVKQSSNVLRKPCWRNHHDSYMNYCFSPRADNYSLDSIFHLLFQSSEFYFWFMCVRERRGEGRRERERESPAASQLKAEPNPWPWDHDLDQMSQTLSPLSHPGAPKALSFKKATHLFLCLGKTISLP